MLFEEFICSVCFHFNILLHLGDFFKTPFPKVDLFVMARVLRNMSQKELDDLVAKCFENLNPGQEHYRSNLFDNKIRLLFSL